MKRIGFIGTGHIAAPMVRHLAGKGHPVAVTRRNADVSQALAAELTIRVGEAQEVVDASDVVFLCLRPRASEEVISTLRFRPGQEIVSVMAGISRAALKRLCAPAARIVQMIPLGYLEQGGCPLAAHGDTDLLEEMFAPANPVVAVASEAALNAHFAICAMIPGILDLMATGADWLGKATGDRDAAEFYTTRLLGGFLAAMETGSAGRLAEERDALATEGTLSLQMTRALRDGGAHDALAEALSDIGKRLEGA